MAHHCGIACGYSAPVHLNVLPTAAPSQNAQNLASLFTVLAIFAMISAMTFFYQNGQKRLVRNIKNDLEQNRQRLRQMETILEESRRNMDIGEELVGATEQAIGYLADVKQRVHAIEGGMEVLNRNISEYTRYNAEILESTAQMDRIVADQNANITESVASITEMTASIKNITGISEAKK